jgi:hypothetical protein
LNKQLTVCKLVIIGNFFTQVSYVIPSVHIKQ